MINPVIGIRSSAADNAALTVGGAKATYLDLTASHSLQGDLNMGGYLVKGLPEFKEDDSSQAASDAQRGQATNFGYFKDQRGNITGEIAEVASDALNRKKTLILWKAILIWLNIASLISKNLKITKPHMQLM